MWYTHVLSCMQQMENDQVSYMHLCVEGIENELTIVLACAIAIYRSWLALFIISPLHGFNYQTV